MSRMKLLGPKVQALRERLKDDPAKMQSEMMALYRAEKVNPASGCLPMVDPVQAKLFQFMPIIFTFMLARFPAGLVIYWSWNNTLSIVQQWFIMRRTRLPQPNLART